MGSYKALVLQILGFPESDCACSRSIHLLEPQRGYVCASDEYQGAYSIWGVTKLSLSEFWAIQNRIVPAAEASTSSNHGEITFVRPMNTKDLIALGELQGAHPPNFGLSKIGLCLQLKHPGLWTHQCWEGGSLALELGLCRPRRPAQGP